MECGKGEKEAASPLSGPGWPAGERDPRGPLFSLPHGWQPGVAPSPGLRSLSPSHCLVVSGEAEQVTEPHVNHILANPQGTGKKAETNAAPW